jgi:hypothetical protein
MLITAQCVVSAPYLEDVIANVAAVLHVPGEMAPETSIARVNEEAMVRWCRFNPCLQARDETSFALGLCLNAHA